MRFKLYSFILIAIAITFSIAKSAAQTKTDESLQIEVADTIELVPEEIILAIAFPRNKDENLSLVKKNTKETTASQIQKIKNIAAKYTTDTLLKKETNLGDNYFDDNPIELYILRFTNFEKLIPFKNELSTIGNIKTFIFQLKSNKIDYWENILFKKVLDRSKKEAEFIAGQVNKKIIAIADLKISYDSDEPGKWISYPPLSMLASYKSINSKEKIILYKKITVKFNWQNN